MSAVQMKTEDVKARPILFSGAMVKSILSGAKTQTRRVITPHPVHDVWKDWTCERLDHWLRLSQYQVGGRLWVRETFQHFHSEFRGHFFTAYRATDNAFACDKNTGYEPEEFPLKTLQRDMYAEPLKWKPSIFMPRWASRITLEITGVRVERLQDISEEDARAEGVKDFEFPRNSPIQACSLRFAFENGWNDLNQKRGYGWDVNPFVWVISFKRAI